MGFRILGLESCRRGLRFWAFGLRTSGLGFGYQTKGFIVTLNEAHKGRSTKMGSKRFVAITFEGTHVKTTHLAVSLCKFFLAGLSKHGV